MLPPATLCRLKTETAQRDTPTLIKTSQVKQRICSKHTLPSPAFFALGSPNSLQDGTNETLSHPRERKSRFLNPWKCSKTSTVARAPPPSQLMVSALQPASDPP